VSTEAGPVQPDLSELAEEVSRFEGAHALAPADFARYVELKDTLEAQLHGLSVAAAQRFELDTARSLLDEIVELNRTLVVLVRRELGRADLSDTYRDVLAVASTGADAMLLLCQGQRLRADAEELQLSGDLTGANTALDQAVRCFALMTNCSIPRSDLSAALITVAETGVAFNDAMLALRGGRYDQAKDGFQQARVRFRLSHDELNTPRHDDDDTVTSAIAGLLTELGDQIVYADTLQSFAEFFGQMKSGNIEDAVECVTDTVALCERWYRAAVAQELPIAARNIRQMETELYHGWRNWAEAELAIEQRGWDLCRRKIREARKHWAACNDIAIRHRLLGVPSARIESGNTEMLLHSTLRRCRAQSLLYEQIDRIQEEKRQVAATVVNQYGGNAVTQDNRDTYNFQSEVRNIGAIGTNARNRADRIGDETGADLGDLRALVVQLADLREAMAQGARGEPEHAAVEQLRQAEEEARRGNENGVRERLKAAGQWALAMAERLGLAAVETAIKASIGG
jgi:hypothetical protein